MCWKSNYTPVKTIAENDIQTQKLMLRKKDGTIISPFFDMTWEPGVVYDTEITLIRGLNSGTVTNAFHSCLQILRCQGFNDIVYYHSATSRMMKELCIADRPYITFHSIIPKGAEYYYNEYGEYASNKLVITEPLKIQL